MHKDLSDIFKMGLKELLELFSTTTKLRENSFENKIKLCMILNAKSGNCSEDCAFCSQSSCSKAEIKEYGIMSVDDIIEAAKNAYENNTFYFSLVTAGHGIKRPEEQKSILKAIQSIKSNTSLNMCASLGIIDSSFLKELKDAGLYHYHHNLEAAESFFTSICSTHSFEDRVKTIEKAKNAGLKVCSGGIFGMGESNSQRLELAYSLKNLNVDSVAINFLNPIPGTTLGDRKLLSPLEGLQILTVFRLLFDKTQIVMCGGRQTTLKSLEPLLFAAGVNALMTGDYLTTKGKLPQQDLNMLNDLDLSLHPSYKSKI